MQYISGVLYLKQYKLFTFGIVSCLFCFICFLNFALNTETIDE